MNKLLFSKENINDIHRPSDDDDDCVLLLLCPAALTLLS